MLPPKCALMPKLMTVACVLVCVVVWLEGWAPGMHALCLGDTIFIRHATLNLSVPASFG